ncbi:MAG TPA: N-acetyltransferase [Candidatus Cryptobacteroides intestinipullorum]|nr:N-acetyltransferase [Candidatus Cryptobacteroides intestinipullorum]
MPVVVKKVSSRREMRTFISFAYNLYKNHPCYVPNLLSDDAATLDRKKNHAFEFCEADYFLAYKDGKVAGRVAAIINHKANEAWNVRQVRFGWIDFIEDIEVLEALLKTVSDWGRERGMTDIAGPLGFTDFDPEGMLVDGFDKMGTMITIYNYEYYPAFFERLGYHKEVDWVEYLIRLPESLPERFEKMANMVMEKNRLKIRHLTMSDIRKEKYGHKMFRLINECYKDLYGYSMLTEKQMDQYVSQYLTFIDLRMVTFIENLEGELVACGITLPSLAMALKKARGRLFPFGWLHLLNALYVNRPDTLDLLLVAAKPEYRSKGLNSVMFYDLIPSLIKLGFKYAESNPELETNLKVQTLWSTFDSQIHKRRRVYAKSLETDSPEA